MKNTVVTVLKVVKILSISRMCEGFVYLIKCASKCLFDNWSVNGLRCLTRQWNAGKEQCCSKISLEVQSSMITKTCEANSVSFEVVDVLVSFFLEILPRHTRRRFLRIDQSDLNSVWQTFW